MEFMNMYSSKTDIQVLALTQVNIQLIQVIKVDLHLSNIEKHIDDIKKLFYCIKVDIEDERFRDLDNNFIKIRQEIGFLVEERVNKSFFNLEIYDFDLKIIQSIYAIISKYKEVCNKAKLDKANILKLKELADNLAEKHSSCLNDDFWFRHKIYHYLNSKKLSSIYCNGGSSNWISNYQQILEQYQNERYNKEELMKFFDDNANKLLLEIIDYHNRMNSHVNKFEFYFILENIRDLPYYRPFYCFDNKQQTFAFMMYIEMEKLNELYQSLEHHGKDILNG